MLKDAASTGLEVSRPIRVEISRARVSGMMCVGTIPPGQVSERIEALGLKRTVCRDMHAADELWERESGGDAATRFLCLVQDGRDWMVSRALRQRARRGAAEDARLFDPASLIEAANAWTDVVGAAYRLKERADRAGAPERVLMLRVEDVFGGDAAMAQAACQWVGVGTEALGDEIEFGRGVWRGWLTEDDKRLLRQCAGSVFEDLGYVGKGGW